MKLIEEYKNGYNLFRLDNDADYIKHERMLYRAFFDKYPWYVKICFNVIEDRLISKIPYQNQVIYNLMKNDEIVCGYSYCNNYKQTFQVEMIGFKIAKNETVYEGLHFYSDLDRKYNSLEIISSGLKVVKYIDQELRSNGIKTVYSSCEPDYINSYKMLDFKKIDEITTKEYSEALLIKYL